MRVDCSLTTRVRLSAGHPYTNPAESAVVTKVKMSRRVLFLFSSNGSLASVVVMVTMDNLDVVFVGSTMMKYN